MYTPKRKLTDAQVEDIRSLAHDGFSFTAIAADYPHVSRRTVESAAKGLGAYAAVKTKTPPVKNRRKGRRTALTVAQVRKVRAASLMSSSNIHALSTRYGVSSATILRAIKGIGVYGEGEYALDQTEPCNRLTPAQAASIRRRRVKGESFLSLATVFGVTEAEALLAYNREGYYAAPEYADPPAIAEVPVAFTEADVNKLRTAYYQFGHTQGSLAKKYNKPPAYVSGVIRGTNPEWAHIPYRTVNWSETAIEEAVADYIDAHPHVAFECMFPDAYDASTPVTESVPAVPVATVEVADEDEDEPVAPVEVAVEETSPEDLLVEAVKSYLDKGALANAQRVLALAAKLRGEEGQS